eukprot:gene19035-23004_t
MDQLAKLGIVSRICTELENHVHFSDKTLAEFILHLAQQNKDLRSFQSALADNGADFPASFTEHLFKVISKMLQPQVTAKPSVSSQKGATKFSALSIPNSAPVPLVGMHEEAASPITLRKVEPRKAD